MDKLHTDIHLATKKTPVPAEKYLSGDRYIDDGLTTWARHNLALALEEHGMDVSFSRGLEAYNLQEGLADILRPKVRQIEGVYQVSVQPAVIAIESIHAIRNIAKVLNNGLPELNHPSVREITGDKLASNDLLRALGIDKAYAGVGSDTEIAPALEHIPGSFVVAKPRYGRLSKDIHIGTKDEILRAFQEDRMQAAAEWIIEEMLDFSEPTDVIATDRKFQPEIDKANEQGRPKELRIYAFGRDGSGKLITSEVLRVAQEGARTLKDAMRFRIEADSVPPELYKKTDDIISALQNSTGQSEIHAAVDWVLAGVRNGEARWLPMEINSGEPALMEDSEDKDAAAEHAHKLASQLYRVALKRST
jgi:hypothetical protein